MSTIEQDSRRYTLQHRLESKKRQTHLIENFGTELKFLDMESTLAIRTRIIEKCFWNPNDSYSDFLSYSVPHDFDVYLNDFSKKFITDQPCEGFCFPIDWATTGIIIIKLNEIMKDLNQYMFSFDDELRFYSHDLSKAICLQGDRSGTWDKLNELQVSVLGANWIKKWETSKLNE